MVLDRAGIEAVIPHRHPFVLIDSIEAMKPGHSATSTKFVSPDEEYFQGHFPGNPVMPGVMIVEAIAQTGAVCILSTPEFAGRIAYFAGLDKVRFKRKVLPGETLRIDIEIGRMRGRIGFGNGKAYVGDELACQAEILFAIG